MTTDPRRPAAPLNDPYNPGAGIRFEEPRKFPLGLMAAVGGGVLAACAVAFFLLYKANTSPADTAPPPSQSRQGIGDDRAPASAATGVAEAPPKEGRIKGTVEDHDGKMVVTKPSQCVMLALNIENVKEAMGPKPDAEAQQWGEARIKQSQDRMALLGCK